MCKVVCGMHVGYVKSSFQVVKYISQMQIDFCFRRSLVKGLCLLFCTYDFEQIGAQNVYLMWLFSCSVVSDSVTPRAATRQASLSFTIFLEFVQSHVHCISDAIQPAHALSSPSPPVSSLSRHQGLFPMSCLFTLGGQTTGASASTSVLPMNIQC